MISFVYALALLAVLLVPVLIVQAHEARLRREARADLLSELSLLAGRYRLHASAQELLPDALLVLDGPGRQLLVVQRLPEGALVHRHLSLNALGTARMPGSTPASDGPIWLEVEHEHHAPLRVCFYEPTRDRPAQRRRQWQRAEQWTALLAQLTGLVSADSKTAIKKPGMPGF